MTKECKIGKIAKVNNHIINLAIEAALNCNWREAIKINKKLLKESSKDLESLLRLGHAYEESNQLKLAKRCYNKVLKIDKFNPIAKRNNLRLKTSKSRKKSSNQITSADFYLEEPGKTKIVSLVNLAPPTVLMKLNASEQLIPAVGKRSICFRDQQKHYVGRLPDDLSKRLIRLISRGNEYVTVVKDVNKKMLQVFIKETKKGDKNKTIISFPTIADQYHTFLSPEMVKEE